MRIPRSLYYSPQGCQTLFTKHIYCYSKEFSWLKSAQDLMIDGQMEKTKQNKKLKHTEAPSD